MSWKTLIIAAIFASFSFGAGAYFRMTQIDFTYHHDLGQYGEVAETPDLAHEKDKEEITVKGRINLLLIGEDNVDESRRSDTVAFVAMDFDHRNIRVLSLPRDTRVAIPRHGTQKLNHAFAYGQEDLLRATVERFLDTPIHYYVKVDYDNFPKLVDMIGGVDIFVGKAMKYDDNWGKLHIDIPAGKNHMDGETALKYVRFRHDPMGDIGRVRRQQQFLKAFLHKVYEPANLAKFATLSREMTETLNTDMPPSLTLQLCLFVKKLDRQTNRVFFKTLPGEPKMIDRLSYWVADPQYAALFLNATATELVSMDMETRMSAKKAQDYLAVTTAEDFSPEGEGDVTRETSGVRTAVAAPLTMEEIIDTASDGEKN